MGRSFGVLKGFGQSRPFWTELWSFAGIWGVTSLLDGAVEFCRDLGGHIPAVENG